MWGRHYNQQRSWFNLHMPLIMSSLTRPVVENPCRKKCKRPTALRHSYSLTSEIVQRRSKPNECFTTFVRPVLEYDFATCDPNHKSDIDKLETIGGLAVVAFWRSPHGPLGSGPPRAGYSQRRKRKGKGEKGKRRKKKQRERKKEKREEKKGKKTWDRYGPVIPCLNFVRHCIQGP